MNFARGGGRARCGALACALLLACAGTSARAQEPRAAETDARAENASPSEADEFKALLDAAARFIQTREFEKAERAIERASTLLAPPPTPRTRDGEPEARAKDDARERNARARDDDDNITTRTSDDSTPNIKRTQDGDTHTRDDDETSTRANETRARDVARTREEETRRARALRQHRASAVVFHRGLLALARGEHERAADLFHAMLARDPRLLRVRLELARALFLGRRDRAARREFERVLAARPPAAVARNVQRFLDAIRRRRAWSADFTFALLPDSNLNQAPSTRIVYIGGLPFTLSDDARETSGVGAHLQLAGGALLRAGERLRVAATARVSRRDYAGRSFDDMTLATSLGPRWLLPRGEAGVAGFSALRTYAGRSYSRETGVRADASHALTPRRRLGLSARVGWLRHEREAVSAARDGPHASLGLHWREGLRANSTLNLWLRYRRERPRLTSLRSRTPTLGIGWTHDFSRGLTLGLEAQAAFTRFDAPHALFGKRRDRTLIGTLRLRKRDLLLRGFTPTLAFTHIRNHSTHTTRDYDRNLLEFSLRRAF